MIQKEQASATPFELQNIKETFTIAWLHNYTDSKD